MQFIFIEKSKKFLCLSVAVCLFFCMYVSVQWCRCVIKSGGQGQSGQAIKLSQITPCVNDLQTLNNPGS